MSVLRQILIVAALGVVAGLGYLFHTDALPVYAKQFIGKKQPGAAPAKSRKSKSSPVITAPVRLEVFRLQTEAVGTTRALQTVEIVPLSSGRIKKLAITSGKIVKAGAIIAELDKDIQVADLAEAAAKLDEAKRSLVRAERLYRKRNVAEALVLELRAKEAVAQADLNRAKRHLADRTVRAPFTGRIGMRKVDVGARVDTDNVLAVLDDLSFIEIEAPISEVLFASVHEGARVNAESAAFPDKVFSGTIASIDPRIDPVGRAFRIRVRVPNADRALPAGMFMRVTLLLNKRQNPAIPEEALVVQADKKFVFVVNGDTVTRTPVKTGQRLKGVIEILDGVDPHTIIVTEGAHRLRDGGKVRIVPDQKNLPAAPKPTAGLPSTGTSGTAKKDGG